MLMIFDKRVAASSLCLTAEFNWDSLHSLIWGLISEIKKPILNRTDYQFIEKLAPGWLEITFQELTIKRLDKYILNILYSLYSLSVKVNILNIFKYLVLTFKVQRSNLHQAGVLVVLTNN